MKRLSLVKIFEGIFDPELPSGKNAHQFNKSHFSGPSEFPYNHKEEVMDEDEIDGELKLEFKTGRVMHDPLNLPNHNLHNGSFSNGKATSFANFPNEPAENNDPSMHDASVESISAKSEENSDIPDEWKKYFETQKSAFKQAESAKPKKKDKNEFTLWHAAKPKIKQESIGMREKGLAYGQPMPTTKQPYASGVPKNTGLDVMSDEEIDKELGLKEYISSSGVLNKRLHAPKADLKFFDNEGSNTFIMNTEEEFDKNQKKRKNEKKNRNK